MAVVLVACGPDDGRQLADPDPDLTAVPVATTAPVPAFSADQPPQGVGPGGLTLSSEDFSPGATMPDRSSCAGEISPALAWTAPPRRVTELALVVQDVDADGAAHWIVTGIPPETAAVDRGDSPAGEVRVNSLGAQGWSSPCPTDGVAHQIAFTLYALDRPLPVSGGDPTSVVTAVQDASLGSASLLGRASPDLAG